MVFSALPEGVFEPRLDGIDHFLHKDESVLFCQAEVGEHLFSIRRGWVKLVHADSNGTNRIVRLMGAGSLLGLELLDQDQHRSYLHGAIACGDVDLCRIPVATMRRFSEAHPELSGYILQRSQQHIDAADAVITDFSTGHLLQRIERVLSFFSQHMSQNGRFRLLSGADMAALVGVSEESVSRVIASFKRQGRLVRRDGLFEYHA